MTNRYSVWPWYSAIAGLLVLDQFTKFLIRRYLPLHDSIPLIGDDFLRLTHVQNPGIAFGVQILGPTPLLIFGWLAALVLVVYLYRLVRQHDPLRWPIMLFIAGAFGNSIDRTLWNGYVTDFVDVDFPDFIMERFAVFNVADSCITIGIVLLLIIVFFNRDRLESAASETHDRIPSPHSDSLPSDHRSGATTPTD